MEIENRPTVDQAMPPLPKRVPTPIGLRLRDFMRGPGQFLVWIGLGLTGLWAAGTAVPTPQLVGVVTATEVAHAFGQAGLLAAVLVEEGDEVKPGDPIARLDSGPLEAQLSVAERQLAAVLADVTALAASQALAAAERLLAIGENDSELVQDGQANRSRVRDEVWRLQIEARERRLAILALEVEIERDLLKADQVRVQAERLTPLVDQGFGRAAEKQDFELEERTLLGQVAANRELLQAQEEERVASVASLDRARGILEGLEAPSPAVAAREAVQRSARAADDAAITALTQRVEIRRAELAALRLEQDGLTLSATIAGRVGLVESRPGQALLAGSTVALVESADARNVTVFLPEPSAPEGDAPAVVLLSRRTSPAEVAAAEVVGYGRGVEELPVRLWRQPQVPEFGRTLIVRPPAALGLIPGEVLGVQLEQP